MIRRIVAAIAITVAALTLTPTAAQAATAPRRTCTDTTTVTTHGRVIITETVRTCPGIRYVKRWVTVPSGKTRLVFNTWPAPAPRR